MLKLMCAGWCVYIGRAVVSKDARLNDAKNRGVFDSLISQAARECQKADNLLQKFGVTIERYCPTIVPLIVPPSNHWYYSLFS